MNFRVSLIILILYLVSRVRVGYSIGNANVIVLVIRTEKHSLGQAFGTYASCTDTDVNSTLAHTLVQRNCTCQLPAL